MGAQMETFAARLATFDATLPSIKSRASTTARTIHPIAWPYDSPSPEQLADAGFFFNPYDTNPDNTTCFLCRRALDGWEDGDNPVEEHLKHSPDCGWAIMMDIQQKSSNPSEIEDPTSASIVDARKATFSVGWPHDGKRGWVCQSDKMVEAGWFFCPSDESPDLASCPYCKLSLDGWEETDDPFEEHHRRSSDCSIFVFALPAAKSTKKGTRSKKTRVSKASRLSTQSVMTTASEAPVDDDQMDISVMSQATAKKGRGGKKSTKPRSKKAKKTDTDFPTEETEITEEQAAESEPVEDTPPEPVKPKRTTRGKKRGSEAISQDQPVSSTTESQIQEPSPKRRATAVRNSIVSQSTATEQDYPEETAIEEASPQPPAKKGHKGAKKAGRTKTRKASTASATTKVAANRSRDESVLGADIEEDLTLTLQNSEPFEFQYKDEKRESARFRKQSISASTANTRNPDNTVADEETGDEQEQQPDRPSENELDPALDIESIAEAPVEPKIKKQPKRKPATKKSKKGKASVQPEPEPEDELEPEPMQLERDHTPQEVDIEENPYAPSEKDVLESSPVQKTSVFKEISVEEPQPAPKQGKKQGRKAKRPTKTTKTEEEPVKRASSVEPNDELAALSLEPTESKSTTRKNGRKRKSQDEEEEEEEAELADQTEPHADDAQLAPTKMKGGRPSKETEDHGFETEQPSKPKAKRGRPAKQSQKQIPEPQQQRKQTPENPEEQEDELEQNVDEDQTLARSSAAIENHTQDVPKTEDQPKRGRPAKSKVPPKTAKEEEDELQQTMDEASDFARSSAATQNNPHEVVSKTKDQPKRGRPSKLKAPPKTTQRYSDLPQDRHRTQSFIESVAQSSSPQNSEGVVQGSSTQERTPSLSPQSSDAENQPPSARPPSARPPIFSPTKTQTTRVPLATSTPTLSPTKRQLTTGSLSSKYSWKPADIEQLLLDSLADKENRGFSGSLNISKQMLTSPEMKMTVDEWIKFNAREGEEKLKHECERLIGIFEKEGGRAMRALEGIECIE
ncbi:Muscle M-line assembly protein unc-89 [Talaromyces islandicus]|uniref:Muscle M-line assembly protein unc-89 n=1 Tax=Talaromyces islandicus TaxID=28573 RepID=A0A0U1M0Y1_TALIS|nr:Muscle M-line assembly protein unc-89 [Talaromyces islandicus]